MRHFLALLLLLGVLLGPMVAVVRAEISPGQVRQAIDRGVAWLKQQQKADGTWGEWMGQPGGMTALATLALLNAGVDPAEEHVQAALRYLRRQRLRTTYGLSLQTMVLAKASPTEDLLKLGENVKELERYQIPAGENKGSWSYPGTVGDNSNSQFALLALHEAERVGVPVSPKTWILANQYWEEAQNVDGSWGYHIGIRGTGSMTCAGITSLIICGDRVQAADAAVDGDHIQCCARGEGNNDRIERGLQWLGRNFSVTGNPGNRGQTWLLYYLYGIERIGRLTAHRFIGQHDWYREGADWLIQRQDSLSGFWKGVGHAEDDPVIGTSLALLFLAKGRRPILMSKLQHAPEEDWNQHRGDVANLTFYVESRWKRDLGWQVVDLQAADVDDLLFSPVLYLCGSASPLPESPQAQAVLAQKLRDYIDRGGFLFAEAYCGEGGFDRGFRALIEKMFPEPEYRLKLLEPEHPIWHAEEKVPADQLRPLWGIEFGCRTSVVYAPLDPVKQPRPSLSCLWELSRPGRGKKFDAAVEAQIAAARSIGVNILAYATNRELKWVDEYVRGGAEPAPTDQTERGRLAVAKLRHAGGCDSAPRALGNLAEAAGRALKLPLPVAARREPLALSEEAIFNYPLLFMNGRTRFRLTDVERSRLKMYLQRGGMILGDSICASQAFTESFRREIAAVLPEQKWQRMDAGDPLLTASYGGFDLATVTRRDPQPASAGGPLKTALRQVPPELEGIKLGDRWAVIFSPYDLSCALEKHGSLECRGYTTDDAGRIAINVLVYSLQQ